MATTSPGYTRRSRDPSAVGRGSVKRRQGHEKLERRRTDQKVDEREISTDSDDYEDAPTSGAYITVKTTKETGEKSYRYYYWRWREGDSLKNEYIALVNPQE
jgi:hypothetical protein